MGFRTTIQGLVQSAFTTIGDIAEVITYTSVIDGDYDSYSGQIIPNNTDYSLKVVVKFGSLEKDKAMGNDIDVAFTGDIEIMFASKDLAVVPTTSDTVTRNEEIYAINRISSDAVNATYTMNLVRLG
jgi:hypothetical protein|tara:strand:+ start:268 stop:648 length:381 start_codon:yes stop_codon:yes gene_type:complete